jgi:hypothetical protein
MGIFNTGKSIINGALKLFGELVADLLLKTPDVDEELVERKINKDQAALRKEAEDTIRFLRELGVEVTKEPEVGTRKAPLEDIPEAYSSIELPMIEGSDYHFSVEFYADGQRNIHANLKRELSGRDGLVYFFYVMLEIYDSEDEKALIERSHEILRTLVEHKTRVLQYRQFRHTWAFECDALVNGKWVPVSAHSVSGKEAPVPIIDGDSAKFMALPLVNKEREE